MPRYPGARWRPVKGHTDGPMRSHAGAVLHVNESNGNLFNWVAGAHNMSCHFEIYKTGDVEQYLDTSTSSWCQMNGNADYVSIETEGFATEPLTTKQLISLGELLAWLHTTHAIPLTLAERPGDRGLGWHGMGGAAWGGHPNCPGPARRSQRAAALAYAKHSVAAAGGSTTSTGAAGSTTSPAPPALPTEAPPMLLIRRKGGRAYPLLIGAARAVLITDASSVAALLAAGVKRAELAPHDYDRVRKGAVA